MSAGELRPGLWTKREAANYLGITVRGVEAMVKARRIPVIRLGHRTVRFAKARIDEALAKLETSEVAK